MVALAGVDIEEKHRVKLQVPYNNVDNILFQASILVTYGNGTEKVLASQLLKWRSP
jgi:hypothetical protein